MSKFHLLKIQKIQRETPSSVSIVFEIPDSLKKDFHFIPGQYLNVKKELNGEELRRAYSICSSINNPEVSIAVKEVEGKDQADAGIDGMHVPVRRGAHGIAVQ